MFGCVQLIKDIFYELLPRLRLDDECSLELDPNAFFLPLLGFSGSLLLDPDPNSSRFFFPLDPESKSALFCLFFALVTGLLDPMSLDFELWAPDSTPLFLLFELLLLSLLELLLRLCQLYS